MIRVAPGRDLVLQEIFSIPAMAGIGTHTINYSITNVNGCSDSDQITITVIPVPDATITPVDTLCINNPAILLVAKDSGGVWSGAVSNNIFNPAVAGVGNHIVKLYYYEYQRMQRF